MLPFFIFFFLFFYTKAFDGPNNKSETEIRNLLVKEAAADVGTHREGLSRIVVTKEMQAQAKNDLPSSVYVKNKVTPNLTLAARAPFTQPDRL